MAFVPSISFFAVSSTQSPGKVQPEETHAPEKPQIKQMTQPAPKNTLAKTTETTRTQHRTPQEKGPVMPFNSCIYDIPEGAIEDHKESAITENLPISTEELGNEALNSALNGKFLPVPQPKNKKYTRKKPQGNFVKLNLSRNASNRKMGQTGIKRGKRTYFKSTTWSAYQPMVYSSGYLNRKKGSDDTLLGVLQAEFSFET